MVINHIESEAYVVVGLQVSSVSLDESLCRHITHALARHDSFVSCQSFRATTKTFEKELHGGVVLRVGGVTLIKA